MEETLKKLSDYQIQAMKKEISFDIDLYVNDKKIPQARVKMQYSVTGGITKGFVFDTTFSSSIAPSKQENRFAEIEHFISTVTGPVDND